VKDEEESPEEEEQEDGEQIEAEEGVVTSVSPDASSSSQKSAGRTGCHRLRAVSMASAPFSSSVRNTATFDEAGSSSMASSSSFLSEGRLESRWMIGHSVVAIPSSVSTLLMGDPKGAPMGGNGWRQPAAGAAESGAVPLERAAITS